MELSIHPRLDLPLLKECQVSCEIDLATNQSDVSRTEYDHTNNPSTSSAILEEEQLGIDKTHLSCFNSQALTAVSGSSSVREDLEDGTQASGNVRYGRVQSWLNSDKNRLSVSPPIPLGESIRDAMVKVAGSPDLRFLPLDKLDAIVTTDNIVEEIRRTEEPQQDHATIQDYTVIARQISDWQGPSHKESTRRKLFAILCLMETALRILDFIKEGLFDRDLPFDFNERGLHRVFQGWGRGEQDIFKHYQGLFLAPYFEFSNGNSSKITELELHHSTVLPYIEEKVKNSALGKPVAWYGGFSMVRKVRVHHAHHNLDGVLDYFAVKELQKKDIETQGQAKRPNPEVEAYKRLNHIQHDHIVRLLATYTHSGRLHMIFPWADGDLHDFWYMHFPETNQLPRGVALARWMSRQFLGLAEALQSIHKSDLDESNFQGLSAQERQRVHGRHGDIKPENILWFKGSDNDDSTVQSFGTLKISDLGSADFHGPESKTVGVSTVQECTETYKAPEFDMKARVSPQYDIWSFGCVLMQFIVWYLCGWEGVREFTERRKSESNRWIPFDDFFNLYPSESKDISVTQAKPSVRKEFERLREHHDCSDFIMDMLHLTQSHLLRMSSEKRAGCDPIVENLRDIVQRCEANPTYCTQRDFSRIKKTPTDLSDVVAVDLSMEMQDELRRVIRPTDSDLPGTVQHTEATPPSHGHMGTMQIPEQIYSPLEPPSSISGQQSADSAQDEQSTHVDTRKESQGSVEDRHEKRRSIERLRVRSRSIFSVFSGCFCKGQ